MNGSGDGILLRTRSVSYRMQGLDTPVAEQANLLLAAEPVLTPHDLTGFLSLLCQDLIPAGRYRYILLQGEFDQRLGRHFHLVSLGNCFGPCARARADARADCCSFAAAGEGADDRSHRRSDDRSLRSARPARFAGQS